MRRICLTLLGLFLCCTSVDVMAARSQNNSTSRETSRVKTEVTNRSSAARTATATPRSTTARKASKKIVVGRNATKKTITARNLPQTQHIARAAATVSTRTFGKNYNSCRDAYFTCMDQFCATQNETYRRCVCSSKLKSIQKKEKTLSQTSESLQDFESFNIDMISKTSKEVKAMLTASEGEAAIKKDKSDSAATLKNISNVLDNSKKKSLSTQGNLDIAGDIKQIWSTTNLIGGSDITNLTGENLFNAVHAQCSELVKDDCAGSDLKMVASAYGMYIENDCALLENNLNNKTSVANSAIRQTRQKMHNARLENYDAHNSASINECITNVRNDILDDKACGQNYVHCLDFSGKYLNITTGVPIYSVDFYQIENQISLSGDILKNNQNASFISMLNKKRSFAEKNLDLCRDDSDDVWNEFLRQALVEIYQQQQERVKEVKNECLQVVNECYLKQSDQLKSLTNESSKINLGQTLELSEEMCADKLDTCSNLYGGGSDGLEILVATMTGITDATIEQSCINQLTEFAQNICSVPDNDTEHSYPYGCRKYAPGESRYARNEHCNAVLVNPFSRSEILTTATTSNSDTTYTQMCIDRMLTKRYTKCKVGYYLFNQVYNSDNQPLDCDFIADRCYSRTEATKCSRCPASSICPGGTQKPVSINDDLYDKCGEYYIGSLYQQFAIYALQNCRRPSDTSKVLSENLIMEIDTVMQKVRTEIKTSLAKECENQNGVWVNAPWIDENLNGTHDRTGDKLHTDFYTSTGANTLWGYCKKIE